MTLQPFLHTTNIHPGDTMTTTTTTTTTTTQRRRQGEEFCPLIFLRHGAPDLTERQLKIQNKYSHIMDYGLCQRITSLQ